MFFKRKNSENKNTEMQGLSISVEELLKQQNYLPYLKMPNAKITSSLSGEVKSAFKGRGMELEEVRAYAYGDDIRDMDTVKFDDIPAKEPVFSRPRSYGAD